MSAIVFAPGSDPHAARVVDALRRRGVPVGVFDLADPSRNRLTVSLVGGRAAGTIRTAEGSFDLDEVDTFYGHFLALRPPPTGESARLFAAEEWMAALIGLQMLTRERRWVNPFEAYVVGESKLLQARAAHLAGLATPDAIVSNDAERLEGFARPRAHGLALKRVSHPFPRLAEDKPPEWVLYTQRVAPGDLAGDKLADAHVCPTHLQDYVEKATEIRAYIVGDAVLAAEIRSQDIEETKVDWRRYPRRMEGGQSVIDTDRWRCRAFDLPAGVRASLVDVARRLGMAYAAMDLILTPQGEYVFLEANAAGAFGFAEDLAGLRVCEALADLATARKA